MEGDDDIPLGSNIKRPLSSPVTASPSKISKQSKTPPPGQEMYEDHLDKGSAASSPSNGCQI